MIQRIQSIHLLATMVLLVMLYFFPYAEFLLTEGVEVVSLMVHKTEGESAALGFSLLPQAALATLCLALSSFAIFLYKRRVVQIRICVANSIMLLGLQGLLFYHARAVAGALDAQPAYSMPFVFPAMGAIFCYLALRGIARDEALVRSMDRLR